MTRENYDGLVNELPNMLVKAGSCPDHLQDTVLHGLISAFIAPRHSVEQPVRMGEAPLQTTASVNITSDGDSSDWDYRREMLRLAKEHSVDLKKLNGQQFATFVAYVFQVYGSANVQEEGITVDILNDASRTADRRLPGNPSATLGHAKDNRLLDKAKGTGRYKLAPKGENLIYDVLNSTNGVQ